MANSLTSSELTLGSNSATSIVRWGGSSILGCGYNVTTNNTNSYTLIEDRDGRIPNMSVGDFFSGYYLLHATYSSYPRAIYLYLPNSGSYEVIRASQSSPESTGILESVQHGPVLAQLTSTGSGGGIRYTEKLAGSSVIASAVYHEGSDGSVEGHTYVRVAILRIS